jgi:hypothetical protein
MHRSLAQVDRQRVLFVKIGGGEGLSIKTLPPTRGDNNLADDTVPK